MKKKNKTNHKHYLLYLFIALAFAAISTAFILSAIGYEIRLSKKEIVFEKTGMIIVNSKPSGASIFVDGENKGHKTNLVFSAKLDSIHKGKHIVRVEKDGFYPWEKEVEVLPETVTWVNYILLFPKVPKIEKVVFNGKFKDSLASEDKKSSIVLAEYGKDSTIYLLDNESGEHKAVFDTAKMNRKNKLAKIKFVEWSRDKKKLLLSAAVGSDKNIRNILLDIETGITKTLDTTFFTGIAQEVTFNDASSNELFSIKNGKLFRVNLSSGAVSNILDRNVVYVLSAGDKVYYVKNIKGKVSLWQANNDASGQKSIYDGITEKGPYGIAIAHRNDMIAFLAGEKKSLYLLKKKEGNGYNLEHLKDGVSAFSWSPDGKRIQLESGNIIFVSDFEDERSIEFGKAKQVQSIKWYDNRHFILKKGNDVIVMDFDGTNTVNIGKSLDGSSVFSSNSRDICFFSSGAKSGQFTLNIYRTDF